MTRVLLDPTSERSPATRERLPRLEGLEGRTVALLDISKPRGDVFLDRVPPLREGGESAGRSAEVDDRVTRFAVLEV